jgi:hypothetical protein
VIEAGAKKPATDALDAAVGRLSAQGSSHAAEALQRRSRNLKRRKS